MSDSLKAPLNASIASTVNQYVIDDAKGPRNAAA